ncbi:MAG TPA: ABC transporter ATP-binding protein [Syntrophomonadaceae bacterium]|nr:ABC transporter ATP-binding protein [Syntrophomonadaceae bacterium]
MKLELNDVAFGYEENKNVFNGVSLTVEAGEVLCLLGPNGAGKTTLFKTLLGLLKPQLGQILLDGRNISRWTRKEIAHFMGYVPQNHIPPFPYSVMDIVLMGRTAHLRNYASPNHHDKKIADASLDTLGISYLRKANYSEISGGERQLVLIARALTQQPQFLVLDEPTSNLDFGNQAKVLNCIKMLADDGLGVIMSSHFPDDAFQYASKVALLKDGQIHRRGTPQEVLTEENLQEIYNVDIRIAIAYSKTGEGYRVCIPVVA